MAPNPVQVRSPEKFLLRALVLSLLIHFAVYGTWKIGAPRGWWRNLMLPAWMQLTPKIQPPIAQKPLPPLQPVSQLVFVDVDPALASPAPPEKPKFYSANNSIAASPKPDYSAIPDIKGHQDKVIKTTDPTKSHAEPLRPSPPKPEVAKTEPAAAPPKKTYTPGDMVMAKPEEKPPETHPDASPQPDEPPVHERPRTIAAALARQGIAGQKSRQKGGAPRIRMDSTLDAAKTSYGNYDSEFIDAVQTRWFQLLENASADVPGKVVLEFRLHPDGRITDMRIVENGVTELLGVICEQAVNDPSPYRPWPLEMRRDFPADYRDIRFTFYYLSE